MADKGGYSWPTSSKWGVGEGGKPKDDTKWQREGGGLGNQQLRIDQNFPPWPNNRPQSKHVACKIDFYRNLFSPFKDYVIQERGKPKVDTRWQGGGGGSGVRQGSKKNDVIYEQPLGIRYICLYKIIHEKFNLVDS